MKWRGSIFIFLALLICFLLPNEFSAVGKRVIAIFTFAFLFWIFEIKPLYVTSLWVVILLALLFVTPSGQREYDLFFSSFSSPLILLFFGGLILASAIKKHRIDEILLTKALRFVGSNAKLLLATMLIMSAFFSMWISNTAAAAMVLTLSKPIFDRLSPDDPMRKSLPLSIAFGCNVGGMGTPIGTPPNVIVLGILREYGMDVSFLTWMLLTLPLVILILGMVYVLLILLYPPKLKELDVTVQSSPAMTGEGKKTLVIAGLMIFVWLSAPLFHVSAAWVALAGAGGLFAWRLVGIEELKGLDWDVLILMWGGLALGTAIEKGGVISPFLPSLMQVNDYFVIALLSFCALFLSTFISNTATANLILPFAVGIASVETTLIAIPVALVASLGMALPVSTPPNALAYSRGSLTQGNVFKTGSLIGLLGLLIILAGFKIMIPWALHA